MCSSQRARWPTICSPRLGKHWHIGPQIVLCWRTPASPAGRAGPRSRAELGSHTHFMRAAAFTRLSHVHQEPEANCVGRGCHEAPERLGGQAALYPSAPTHTREEVKQNSVTATGHPVASNTHGDKWWPSRQRLMPLCWPKLHERARRSVAFPVSEGSLNHSSKSCLSFSCCPPPLPRSPESCVDPCSTSGALTLPRLSVSTPSPIAQREALSGAPARAELSGPAEAVRLCAKCQCGLPFRAGSIR